ncbi:hypothetical protein [Streptomyces sp. NPDC005408]|uniref:hypothetical protein n=1 Tax=Streptomyces sp. NPDC005408 TaxID=3155341 RepID=UPI0033B0B123
MATDRSAERVAIQTAADRLLAGTPQRSTGALTVLQLAAEAGVKRWVLTHKHPDLKDDFLARRTLANGIPPAFQHLQARASDLEERNRRLLETNRHLTERVETYAQVIAELLTERDRLHTPPPVLGTVLPYSLGSSRPSASPGQRAPAED